MERTKELSVLIDTIVSYYSFMKEKDDEGEEWKVGTDKDNPLVPTEINELVAKTFLEELKRFNQKSS